MAGVCKTIGQYLFEVQTSGKHRDGSDAWTSNSTRYDSEAEAKVAALKLQSRWLAVTDWRVRRCLPHEVDAYGRQETTEVVI